MCNIPIKRITPRIKTSANKLKDTIPSITPAFALLRSFSFVGWALLPVMMAAIPKGIASKIVYHGMKIDVSASIPSIIAVLDGFRSFFL